MVNEQIGATLDLIFQIEHCLKEDVASQAFTLKLNEKNQSGEDARKLLRQRRQSVGNISIAQIHSQLRYLDPTGPGLNESADNTEKQKASRVDQINATPSNYMLKKLGKEIDQSMLTEIEYIKCLQDNTTNMMNESSFFKSFINVERSNGASKDDEKARNEEIHALRDINE